MYLNGEHAQQRELTLDDFVADEFAPSLKSLKRASERRYRDCYNKHIAPVLGLMPIKSIKYVHCQNLINDLDLAPATVQFARGLLVSIFNHAERLEFVNKNPARLVKGPKKPRKRERALSADETLDLLKRINNTEIGCAIFLAVVLGLRRGEVCGLMWEDLDRQSGKLFIRRQAQHMKGFGGGVELTDLKTDAGRRVLPLTKPIVEQIDRLGNLDCAYITGEGKKPMNPHTLYQRFTAIKTKVLMLPEDFTFHDLRRCSASLMHLAGIDPLKAQHVLGHADADMSAYYMTMQQQVAEESVKAVSRLLFGAKPSTRDT